jgi:hypothetical protein
VLSQSERVLKDLFAEAADEVADSVLDLGQLGLRLLRHLDHVQLRIEVT